MQVYLAVTPQQLREASRFTRHFVHMAYRIGPESALLRQNLLVRNGRGMRVLPSGTLIGPRIYAAAEGTAFAQAGESGGNYARAGSAGSLIELKTDQLDFALTQRIVTGLQAKFAVQNILNHPIQIAEDENFTYKYEKAAVVQERDPGAGGAIFSGDQISSSYKRYPSFNLALTYSF